MSTIPTDSRVFLDTNILLYAVTEHPRFGPWCDALLDRIQRGIDRLRFCRGAE